LCLVYRVHIHIHIYVYVCIHGDSVSSEVEFAPGLRHQDREAATLVTEHTVLTVRTVHTVHTVHTGCKCTYTSFRVLVQGLAESSFAGLRIKRH